MALDYALDFSLVTDLLRAKIFVTSLAAMHLVIRAMAAHPQIQIVKVKNRVGQSLLFSFFLRVVGVEFYFAYRWLLAKLGDCMIKLYMKDDAQRHIAEVCLADSCVACA